MALTAMVTRLRIAALGVGLAASCSVPDPALIPRGPIGRGAPSSVDEISTPSGLTLVSLGSVDVEGTTLNVMAAKLEVSQELWLRYKPSSAPSKPLDATDCPEGGLKLPRRPEYPVSCVTGAEAQQLMAALLSADANYWRERGTRYVLPNASMRTMHQPNVSTSHRCRLANTADRAFLDAINDGSSATESLCDDGVAGTKPVVAELVDHLRLSHYLGNVSELGVDERGRLVAFGGSYQDRFGAAPSSIALGARSPAVGLRVFALVPE